MLDLPPLGHGIGLRTVHFPHYLAQGARGLDGVEIISENFFEPGGRPWAVLEKVRAEVPSSLTASRSASAARTRCWARTSRASRR